MNTKKYIERKIQLNAILIYVIVALLCVAMFIYLYTQKESIGSQKQNIEKSQKTLVLTNNLITYVNYAQANANLYIVSKKPEYILQFADNVNNVQISIDSIKPYFSKGTQEATLDEIESLLNQKVSNIADLNLQFDNYYLVDSISKRMRAYELSLLDNVVEQNHRDKIITTIIEGENDTIRKKFIKRLAEAFAPEKKISKKTKETTIVETEMDTSYIDPTLRVDSMMVLTNLLNTAHKTSKNYNRKIVVIEKQVAALMMSDHEISVKLSNLLINLHQQTINSTMQEIRKSEQIISKNYINSIVGSLISLALVLILIIFIIRNVTKGRNMIVALERANILTKKTFESRHNLLLSISHDVKTPVNSILGYLNLWEHGHVMSPKEVATMQHSGRHVLDLMENLLEFSRLDQGLAQVTAVDFQLYELCSEIAEVFKPLALQKKLAFEMDFDLDHNVYVHSDLIKIKQILLNILSNAIKYTVKGKVCFHINYKEGIIQFEISDTGKGIPSEQLDIIFEPFRRVEENNILAPGSGFGLFVAKGMTELLKGTITVYSTVDQGTRMLVEIPALRVDKKSIDTASKRILVIDDDIAFLSILEKMLLNLGHNVNTCHSIETYEQFSKQIAVYDAVLTDADMGTFSGMDILQKVRDKRAKLPVILMSGHSDLNEEKAKTLGFNNFLSKPITIASLQQIFGGNTKISDTLFSLEELFDGNADVIWKVLDVFIDETKRHIILLEEAINQNDFQKTKQICHKMLPMFLQMKVNDAVGILNKINDSQEQPNSWQEDIFLLINISNELITKIGQEKNKNHPFPNIQPSE